MKMGEIRKSVAMDASCIDVEIGIWINQKSYGRTSRILENDEEPGQLLGLLCCVGIQASALSRLNLGVDGLEFCATVVDFHSPVDSALSVVNIA